MQIWWELNLHLGLAQRFNRFLTEVVLTEIWAQRLAGTGIVVHSMHPGWVDTAGIRASLPRFYRVTRPLLRTAVVRTLA